MVNQETVLMGKKALITGVTGQDGSYLTELLLSREHIAGSAAERISRVDGMTTVGSTNAC
jgi:GDP-D-mannose dehydratase